MFNGVTSFDPIRKIWSGQTHVPVFNPKGSLGQAILRMMARDPDKVLQISADSGKQLTSNEIRIRGIRMVRYYARLGVKEGDVVGIVADNSPHLTPIVLGSILSGIALSSLAPTYGKRERTHVYSTSRPNVVFCDAAYYDAVKSCLDELGLSPPISIITGSVEGVPNVEDFLEVEDGSDYDYDNFICPILKDARSVPTAILCSSGSTGLPKGTYISQASLMASTELMNLTTEDVLFTFSTIDWYSGIWYLILNLLTGTKRIITREKFSSGLTLRILEDYKVTALLSPPPQMVMILQDPNLHADKLSSLKLFISGGSTVSQSVATVMNTYLKNGKVCIIYGMTEMGTITHLNLQKDRLDSVGPPISNIKLKIINNNGESLGIGEKGEILQKPPYPFLGYCGRPEESKSIYDKDGFIHTGDIGYMDSDGFLILCDRKKDVIQYENYQFFPSEIENILLKMSGVAQTCVCGIPGMDGNDLAAAFIVKKEGCDITEQEILNYTEKNLDDWKLLRGGVYFVDSIPMTASGKYQRHISREMIIKLYNSRRMNANDR